MAQFKRYLFSAYAPHVLSLVSAVGIVNGCAHATPAETAQPAQPKIQRDAQIRPAVVELGSWEQCQNAWDDNENGLIDEGCSIPQSQVQVLVAWDDVHADLDLMVYDPQGEVATLEAPTASGLSLHLDCPAADECSEQPYELAYVEDDEYVAGNYRIVVLARTFEPKTRPLSARLGIRTPESTQAYTLEFYDQAQSVSLDFFVAGAKQKE